MVVDERAVPDVGYLFVGRVQILDDIDGAPREAIHQILEVAVLDSNELAALAVEAVPVRRVIL